MTTAPEAEKAGGFDVRSHPKYRVATRSCVHSNCWAAWCRTCRTKITQCDFTARDALGVAIASEHDC